MAYKQIVTKTLAFKTFCNEAEVIMEQITAIDEKREATEDSDDELSQISSHLREMNQNISPLFPILQNQISNFETNAEEILTNDPQRRKDVKQVMKHIKEMWNESQCSFNRQNQHLQTMFNELRFDHLATELENWFSETFDKLLEDVSDLKSLAECETAVVIHTDLDVSFNFSVRECIQT